MVDQIRDECDYRRKSVEHIFQSREKETGGDGGDQWRIRDNHDVGHTGSVEWKMTDVW